MDLLARRHKDILPKIDTIALRRGRHGGRNQKQKTKKPHKGSEQSFPQN
jgi:hypothetical protein